MKGLRRSLSRGPAALQEVVKIDSAIAGSIDITGVDSAVDAGVLVLGGLPKGNLLLLGAVAYIKVDAGTDASVINNWAGDFGIGYSPNVDVDLADAEEDAIVASTPLVAGASDKVTALTRATSTQNEHGLIIDNTSGAMELNFNLLIDDNVVTDTEVGTFAISGSIHIALIVLGDD